MVYKILVWMADTWVLIWNFLLSIGTLGYLLILLPVIRKIVKVMRQFTN